jgi:hypothetical protein
VAVLGVVAMVAPRSPVCSAPPRQPGGGEPGLHSGVAVLFSRPRWWHLVRMSSSRARARATFCSRSAMARLSLTGRRRAPWLGGRGRRRAALDVTHFAADADSVKTRVLYAVQPPLGAAAFNDVVGVPARKSLPSLYQVAAEDQAQPPDAERLFPGRRGATFVAVPSGHLTMVADEAHPGAEDWLRANPSSVEAWLSGRVAHRWA